MSGAATTTTTQSLTGNLNIDGLLYGRKWNASSITYSNPNSSTDYQAGYSYDQDGDGINVLSDGFGQINASQLVALQSALDSARFGTFAPAGGVFAVEGFTNLSVSAAASGSGAGTIRVANSTDTATGYAFLPAATTTYAGDVFLNNTDPFIGSTAVGNYGWHTMLHEVGHALGLKHGHLAQYGSPALPAAVDSLEFSVMTYRSRIGGGTSGYTYDDYSAPQTFMQLDILALQTMYGANYNTNNTDTTYTWSTTDGTMYINGQVALDPGGSGTVGNKIFATIWDGGGSNDTYDLSNFTTAVSIDLAPGAFSTINPNRLADLDFGGIKAQGNIANALLFNGDTRSYIDNAKGGSHSDTIRGNDGMNGLHGNGGNDTLYGFGGSDGLFGGDGNDILDGGTGGDSMWGGTGNDTYYVDYVYESVFENDWEGTDKIYASSSFDATPASYVEEIQLTGTANNYLYGNATWETLIGNSGNNRIDGRGGDDVLVGGSGLDTFVFSTSLGSNVDFLQDFSVSQDKIELSRSVFSALNAGTSLNASAFRIGSAALDADDRVFYDSVGGYLAYDSDGNGAAVSQVFATIQTGLALTASHFTIA